MTRALRSLNESQRPLASFSRKRAPAMDSRSSRVLILAIPAVVVFIYATAMFDIPLLPFSLSVSSTRDESSAVVPSGLAASSAIPVMAGPVPDLELPAAPAAPDAPATESALKLTKEVGPASAPPPDYIAKKMPACARDGKRAKTFLMIFMGHSGSSAILSELYKHSETYQEEPEAVDHGKYEFNTTLALKYTREFFERGVKLGKAAGFKMRPNHIQNNPEAWAALAREFDTRIIWQFRRNIVKSSVGEYSLLYLNDTSVIEGLRGNMTEKERCKIGVGCHFAIDDYPFFHNILKNGVNSDRMIARAVHMIAGKGESSCVHAVPYENYLSNRERAMRELQTFLGIKHEDHQPLRRKATKDNLCDVITNWKDLCSKFYSCHAWREMMDDPHNNCTCEDFSSGSTEFCGTEMS